MDWTAERLSHANNGRALNWKAFSVSTMQDFFLMRKTEMAHQCVLFVLSHDSWLYAWRELQKLFQVGSLLFPVLLWVHVKKLLSDLVQRALIFPAHPSCLSSSSDLSAPVVYRSAVREYAGPRGSVNAPARSQDSVGFMPSLLEQDDTCVVF